MVGMFVSLCLSSKKPSEREFFVPARMDLGVKLLIIYWYIMGDAPLSMDAILATIFDGRRVIRRCHKQK